MHESEHDMLMRAVGEKIIPQLEGFTGRKDDLELSLNIEPDEFGPYVRVRAEYKTQNGEKKVKSFAIGHHFSGMTIQTPLSDEQSETLYRIIRSKPNNPIEL